MIEAQRENIDNSQPSQDGESVHESEAIWYVAQGQKQKGPYSLKNLKEHAAAGTLKPADQVWRQGFANWSPAANIPELFSMQDNQSSGPLLVPINSSSTNVILNKIIGFFGSPMIYFFGGFLFAAASILTMGISAIRFYLKKDLWIDEALLFFILFVICEASCGILDAVRRMGAKKE